MAVTMQKTRRVVIVLDYGDVRGGLEKVAVESALGLKKQGMEVVFFCGVSPVDTRLSDAGIEVVCLDLNAISTTRSKLFQAQRLGLWNVDVAKALDRTIRSTPNISETVVHVHSWTKSLSSAIGPVVTAPDIRHVFTMHEYFFACPNGGFFDYQRNEICHRDPMSLSCISTNCDSRHASHKAYRLVRHTVQRQFGKLPKYVRNIIYISALQHKVMRPHFPAETKFFYLKNPVVDEKKEKVDVSINSDFYFVGRLVAAKGALEFAKATAKVGVNAVFVGDGPMRKAIEDVNPQARILGWTPSERIPDLLRQARALVFPSLWYECQPLVPLEAKAEGVPVICGDWTAAHEDVEDGVTGLIIRKSTANVSLEQALRLMLDPRLAGELGRNAYSSFWRDPLTTSRHVQGLLEVYEKI